MFRESEKLMADPAVEQGDRTIAVGMAGRYDGLHFDNKWADRVHQTGAKVCWVLPSWPCPVPVLASQNMLWWWLSSDNPSGCEICCSNPGTASNGDQAAGITLAACVAVEHVRQRV